jgi:TonB family protein
VRARRVRAALLAGLALLAPAAAAPEPPNPYAEGASVLGVDGVPAGPSVAQRLEEIRARLQAALVYPPLARKRGLEGTSRIEFVIGPDGRARDVRTAASSGYPVLDAAAERCARDAGQLPRVLGRLEVPIRFSLEEERRRGRTLPAS